MKRILLVLLGVVVLGVVIAAVLVKRVPDGFEAVRVSLEGDISVYDGGYHLIPPGAKDFILYPTGSVSYRYPKYGAADVMTESGETVQAAFEFTLGVPTGSSRKLYERFSEDFEAAMRRLIQAAAEIEAASFPSGGNRQEYLDAVARNVSGELRGLGVTVSGYSLPVWGDEVGKRARAEAGVGDEPPRKLIVVGVDGGDWLNLRPLIDSGRLPNFARLMRDGATGPLRSIEPMLSPLLWTTIATGMHPEDHGILNFTIVDPKTGKKVPITRYYRKADAFWNILGDYGRSVAIVGWLATHPAEKVQGVMVTDKAGYLAFAPEDRERSQTGLAAAVCPDSRAEEVSGLIVHGEQVPYDECNKIIHIDKDEFEKHSSLDFDPKDSINNLILLYASARSFENIALHLLAKDRPDVLAVYFEWVDAVSHLFMLHSPPKLPDIPAEEYNKFKDAIEQTYIVQDEILGKFMDRQDDDTILMVISDHGFKSGSSRLKNRPEIWAGNAAMWHRLDGIVALYGRGVRKGYTIEDASILDVTPTILALQGLPRAADMPGNVWLGAFESSLQQELNSNTVATLQRDRGADTTAGPPPAVTDAASAEAMKKLEALGYLTPDNADALNNLGQRYEARGEYLKAIEEYRKAIALRPDFHAVYNNIAVCYGKLGRLEEAEQALLKTIEIKPDDFYAMNNLAVTYIKTQKMEEARRWAERAVRTEPGYVNGHVTLGAIYAMTGEFSKAEKEYETALELDPGATNAADNLKKLRQQLQSN